MVFVLSVILFVWSVTDDINPTVVWCGAVRCGVVCHSVVQYIVVWCGVV